MKKSGRFWIFMAVLVSLGQSAYYWPRLPAKLASHFGIDGQANGWQSKEAFFALNFCVILLLAVLFVGLPIALRRLPASVINLPHKEYWLAPERREETLSFLQNQLELIGASALLLVTAIMQMAMKANLTQSPALPSALLMPLMAGFIIFELMCVVRILTRFSAPPK